MASQRNPFILLSMCSLLITGACTSSYVPRQRGQIAVAMKGGQLAYHRDGRVFEHGFAGGGLVDVVKGVPAAEVAANKYRNRSIWGFVGVIGGAVCSTTALAYSLDNRDKEEGLLATSLLCTAVTLASLGVVISAVPYQYDAINLFNDAHLPTGPVYLPGQAPRGYGAPGSY